jgi:hypothetical protein
MDMGVNEPGQYVPVGSYNFFPDFRNYPVVHNNSSAKYSPGDNVHDISF